MNQRFQLRHLDDRSQKHPEKTEEGPVITISREVGCSGDKFARLLAQRINRILDQQGKRQSWKWVNKQILSDSADQLGVDVSKIRYVFKAERKGTMDEIIGAISSKYYKNDRIIRKTVKKVVDQLAWQGKIIIVGRGGVAFTKNVHLSLHIKLMAPLPWRIDVISKKHGISQEAARKYVIEVDEKRKQLVDIFMEKKADDSIFDLILNCETTDIEERLTTVINILEKREII